jgi:acyl-CoA dehydrogenase
VFGDAVKGAPALRGQAIANKAEPSVRACAGERQKVGVSHCMRWLGSCIRANEVAIDYANRRQDFGKALIDHEGVGFMLADNLIDLKQSELMIGWCVAVLDTGLLGVAESSMTKVAVSEALMRIAGRCVQVMGGTGVSRDAIVEQVFREIRAFRISDGPTEVHKWPLAKKIKRDSKATWS